MNSASTTYEALKEVASLSGDAVVLYDLASSRFTYLNPVFFELLHLDPESFQATENALMGLIISNDRDFVKRQFTALLGKGALHEIEFKCKADLEILTVRCNAYLIANKSLVVASFRDITEPKQHEEYIIEFGARKNTVLDNLTHQISGALLLMKDLSVEASKLLKTEGDHRVPTYLKLLIDNVNYCLGIINDLMQKEHETSPGISVKNSRIDLVERINIIYAELVESYKGRKFHFNRDVDSLFINTDEVKLLQVINNLVSNALKFSPDEGPITITLSNEKTNVLISINDRGIGIPEAWHSLIFKRNSGIGRPGLRGERSIGIGLSICKDLVSLLSGNIWFESVEGAGSTFHVSLPKD